MIVDPCPAGKRRRRIAVLPHLSALLLGAAASPAFAGPTDAIGVIERDASGAPAPETAVLPARLDDDRLFVMLDFVTPDGRTRPALAWVNMGMATFTLADGLKRELGSDGFTVRAGGIGMSVGPEAVRSADAAAFAKMLGPMPVEAVLPASALSKFRVTVDYGGRTLTLSRRVDAPAPTDAAAAPLRVNPSTGVASVQAKVDGRAYHVVLDCGAGYSWLRAEVVKDWLHRHPDWLRAAGAPGQANQAMTGEAFEHAGVTVRVPEMEIGDVRLASVGVLGAAGGGSPLDAVKASAFWALWGSAAPEPPSGWIGGSALRSYSVTLDYAHGQSYWRAETSAPADDLRSVAISLVRGVDGYTVGGRVRDADGAAPPAGIAPGDAVISIDGRPAASMTRGDIIAALHGAPGETRRILFEHRGVRSEVDAPIVDFEAGPKPSQDSRR